MLPGAVAVDIFLFYPLPCIISTIMAPQQQTIQEQIVHLTDEMVKIREEIGVLKEQLAEKKDKVKLLKKKLAEGTQIQVCFFLPSPFSLFSFPFSLFPFLDDPISQKPLIPPTPFYRAPNQFPQILLPEKKGIPNSPLNTTLTVLFSLTNSAPPPKTGLFFTARFPPPKPRFLLLSCLLSLIL